MSTARLGAVVLFTTGVAAACAPNAIDSSAEIGARPPLAREPSSPPSLGGEGVAGPPPTYGPTRHLAEAPPPISGGTLLVTRNGAHAVAADPDRDRVFIVGLATQTVRNIVVDARSEPGRATEDGAGIVHLVLRRTGEIIAIDPATATVLGRRFACAGARGIAFDGEVGRLLVACSNGDVMALPVAPDATPVLFGHFDADLRDVVVTGGRTFVSTFRSANVIEVSKTGGFVRRLQAFNPAIHDSLHPPRVAWRMIGGANGSGEPLVVHQLLSSAPVATSSNASSGAGGGLGYGSAPTTEPACGENVAPVVITSLTKVGGNGAVRFTNGFAPLPVDVATDGDEITIVAAGNGHTPERPQLFTYPSTFSSARREQRDPAFRGLAGEGCTVDIAGSSREVGQLTAIAYAGKGRLVLQSREPAQLVLWPERIVVPLSNETREDTGHAIFHSNSSAGLACASCHAEGGDDGHTWSFIGVGMRRTPSLLGTLEGTAPYHWDGDMSGIAMLADNVFTSRMRGPSLDGTQKTVLEQWLFALPPPRATPSKSSEAIARGKALFESPALGCTTCHAGAKLTSAASADVGTGGVFQVPSLVGVGARAPFLHDGCAKTLYDRFGKCGSDMHGKTSGLSGTEIDDLVGYLESL